MMCCTLLFCSFLCVVAPVRVALLRLARLFVVVAAFRVAGDGGCVHIITRTFDSVMQICKLKVYMHC